MRLNIQGWLISRVIQTGMILPFGGVTAPKGFFLCNGSAVSRTTYAALFSIIGTAYGAGDGTTTFNLPNLPNLYLLNGLSVNTPAQNCRGTGKTLGLTAGSNDRCLAQYNGSGLYSCTNIGGNVGDAGTVGPSEITAKILGVSTNAGNSGIMRDAIISSISNYQSARAIIKY